MTAAITPDPGKSEVEIAAVQVVVDDIHHVGAPEAVTPPGIAFKKRMGLNVPIR
jgi:hypothetical protein